MNLKTLYNETRKLASSRSQYFKNPCGEPCNIVEVVPNLGNNTVVFVFESQGVTEAANHLSFIEFRNVKFIPDEEFDGDEDQYYSIGAEGKLYWLKKQKMTNTVRVCCSCTDYYMVWAFPNWKKGANFGKRPLPYRRKTPPPPIGRPYRNPQNLNGICKHLFWEMIELIELGILEDTL